MLLGSYFELPIYLIIWFAVIWLIVFASGHEPIVEFMAISAFGLALGFLIWQLTGGEAWFNLAWLEKLSAGLTTLRDTIVDRIFLALPEPHGSLLSGILFGNRLKLDAELIEQFRVVGLSHVVAVSGYNLTILALNLRSLFRPMLGRRTIYLSMAVILLFVLISGAPASILRAAVMAALLLSAEIIGRPSRGVNILIIGAGLLALFEPKIILEVGFQLSLAATYGLLRLSPLIAQALESLKIPGVVRNILAETLAATILTAPIIITYFERLSLISPVSNLLVLPIIPLLMGLGLIGSLVILFSPIIGGYLLLLTWPLLEWTIRLSAYLASLPYSTTNLAFNGWVAAALTLMIITLTELLQTRLPESKVEAEPALIRP